MGININTQHAEERMGDTRSLDALKSSTSYILKNILEDNHQIEKTTTEVDRLQEFFDIPSYQAQEQIAELSATIESNEVQKPYNIDISGIEIASRTGNLSKFLEAETRA